MWFVAILAATTIVNAEPNFSLDSDPRCKKMDQTQWDDFPHKDQIREWAFGSVLGISPDSQYTDVLFESASGHGYFCAEGWNTVFSNAEPLQCIPNTVDLLDKSVNAPGSATIDVQTGIEATTTVHESSSSSVASNVVMTMSAGIPLLGDFLGSSFSRKISINSSFTRESAHTQTFKTSTVIRVARAIDVGSGISTCVARMTTITCQHKANGTYPVVAAGLVGWNLKHPVIINGKKEWKWFVPVEQFYREKRQILATLEATISSTTYATVVSHCRSPDGDEIDTGEPSIAR